ncbi:hypothetical protein [Kitasatospora sp. KL5]|uniref:hypothetical protein n=1 Tax=Kitasatospora sp. KL5 TaxID=3425125 RepID=UPI003D6F9A07
MTLAFPARTGAALAAAALLLPFAAACSSGTDGGTPSGPAPASGGPSADDGAIGTDFTAKGIVITADCRAEKDGTKARVSLTGWRPDTAKPVAEVSFALPEHAQFMDRKGPATALQDLCLHNNPQSAGSNPTTHLMPRLRQLFDRDYQRLAVTVRDPQTGGSHVGHVDRAGKYTDLTAKAPGAAGVPAEQDALFAPDGRSLWFTVPGKEPRDPVRIASRAADTGALAERATAPLPSARTQDAPQLWLVGDKPSALLAFRVSVSPDGTRAVGANDPTRNGFRLWDFSAASPTYGTRTEGTADVPKIADTPFGDALSEDACVPWRMLDGHRVLCTSDPLPVMIDPRKVHNFWILDVDKVAASGRYDAAASGQPILTQLAAADEPDLLAVSPDGGQLLYRTAKSQNYRLFVAPTTPDSTPKELAGSTMAGVLAEPTIAVLEWR